MEEMPAFPDKESSLLNKLYETAPWTAKLHQETESAPAVSLDPNAEPPIQPVDPTGKCMM